MADTLQHGSITGNASVRQKVSGKVVIGGKIMKELRFLPYSEFPEIGREETLYIDTDNNAMYYYDGSAYVALSGGGGGGTDNYNALSNKPSVNSVTLIGNKTSSELGLQELISDLSDIRSGAASGSTAVQPETLETALSEKQDAINDLDDIRNGASAGATAVQPSDMESALADKQDVISDLSTIRSGAASGATAVQPSDMETALSSKQDVISDLSDIRSGASAGATAVQPSDMETALSGKQDTISDLQTIRSGASLGATAVQPVDMETALADKQDVIADLDTIRSGATAGNTALQPEDIDTLPTDGSSNPVSSGGTYNFVNSSIATNTAYFIGTFASVEELEAYTGTVTNNDYAFVTSTDSAGNTLYNRYKYNAATQTWSFEYAVNNTAFTAAQWAAIQSGLTASDKTKLDGIEQGANKTVIDAAPTSGSGNAVSSGGVHTALSGKQDTIADLSDIRSGASAGSTAVQPSMLNDYQTKLSGTNKLDPSYIDYDASHRAVTDTEKSTWNGKQDTIPDLSTIRSGAAAGATALQQSDVSSTYSATGTAPVNGTAVNAAIGTLDVLSVGGSGKYISAISETNGKIAATPTTFDTVLSSSSTDSNAPTTKAVYDDQQRQEVEIGDIANRGAKNLFKNGKNASATVVKQGATWVFDATSVEAKVSGSVSDTWSDVYLLNSSLDLSDKEYTIVIESDSPNLFMFIPGNTLSGGNIPANGQYYPGVYKYKGIMTTLTRFTAKTASYSNNTIRCMICPASITDSTFQPYAKTNRELTVAEAAQDAEIAWNANQGVKNLLRFDLESVKALNGGTWSGNANTINGVTTTVNDTDKTISFVKTAAGGDVYFRLTTALQSILSSGSKYILSGATGGSSTAFYLGNSGNWENMNGDTEITYTGSFASIYVCVKSTMPLNTTITIKPMIRPASITDSTFQPYALSNPVLTPAAIKAVDEGAKNLLNPENTVSDKTLRGVTVTRTGDVYSFSGTAEDNSNIFININNDTTINNLPAGDYVAVFEQPQTDIKLQVGINGTITYTGEFGQPLYFSIPASATSNWIRFFFVRLVNYTGRTARIMICTAADWAVSQKFVPYRPSWQEMWEMIQSLQNNS